MCQLCLICLRYSTSDNHNSSVMNTIPHGDNDDAILNSVLANHRQERHLSPSIHMVSHKILLLHRLRNKWLKRQCMQQMAESLRAWTAVSVVQGNACTTGKEPEVQAFCWRSYAAETPLPNSKCSRV
jgi:hypothetical protein